MESDLSLIEKIKSENNENSLVELIERHSGIYIYIVDQFSKNHNPLLDKSLILEDKDCVIYESAMKYNPKANVKFSTYLANQARWMCLNHINKKKKIKESSMQDLELDPSSEETPLNEVLKLEGYNMLREMLEKENDERVKKIIDIRYNSDNIKLIPWRVIADELKLSIQGCINIHDRFIAKVQKELNKKKNYV